MNIDEIEREREGKREERRKKWEKCRINITVISVSASKPVLS